MHLYCILLLANFFDEFEVILSKQKFDVVGVLWKRNSCISLLLRTNGQFHAWKTFFEKKEWMAFKLRKLFIGILRYSGILSLVLGQAKSQLEHWPLPKRLSNCSRIWQLTVCRSNAIKKLFDITKTYLHAQGVWCKKCKFSYASKNPRMLLAASREFLCIESWWFLQVVLTRQTHLPGRTNEISFMKMVLTFQPRARAHRLNIHIFLLMSRSFKLFRQIHAQCQQRLQKW